MNYEKILNQFLSEDFHQYCGIEYLNVFDFIEQMQKAQQLISEDKPCYLVTVWGEKDAIVTDYDGYMNFVGGTEGCAAVRITNDKIIPAKSFSTTREQFLYGEY